MRFPYQAMRFAFLIIVFQPLFVNGIVYGSYQQTEAEAHADKAWQFARAGDLADAEVELRRAVQLAPDNPGFLANLGTVLAMETKLDDSTKVFERALKLDPNDLTVRRYLAANLWQVHRDGEAKQNLELILKEKPDDQLTRLLDNVSMTLVLAGGHEPATSTSSEAVPMDSLWDCACPDRWVRLCAGGTSDVVRLDRECIRVQSG